MKPDAVPGGVYVEHFNGIFEAAEYPRKKVVGGDEG